MSETERVTTQTIQFDDQSFLKRDKIGNVVFNGLLSSELDALHLFRSEMPP